MNKPAAISKRTGAARQRGRLPAAALALLCALGAGTALANGPNDPPANQPRREEGRPAQRDSREAVRERRWGDYEQRAEEQRRAMQDNVNNAEMNRRVGRMTADEKRDLRRQIQETGQELYALPPRR